MADRFDIWLARVSDSGDDPVSGLRQAGLRDPRPDYASIARTIATLVERTGLLGLAGVWGDPQLVGRHFLGFGTEAQRAAWLGRARAVGISEPNVGAHPKLLTTRAEPAPKGFRVTSQKAWVTNGPCADAIIVFAITAQEAGRRRCSTFIVPRGLPGVAIAEMPGLHALRPSRHRLLTLEGCGAP
jgi:acyl-CoA dehydrogenase